MNMALDEAILEGVIAGESLPTLRLYAWTPPCLSIGYAQPVGDVDRERLARAGWDLVRRPTGGRALLHADELTYAVIAPASSIHLSGGVLESYRKLSRGLIAGLELLGLTIEVQPEISAAPEAPPNPICFEVPSAYELTAQGRKLVGSAQVRRRDGVLQHGSIPLTGDITRICGALTFADEEARSLAADRLRRRAASVQDLLGRPITWKTAAAALAEGFAVALDLHLQPAGLTEQEEARAAELHRSRYQDPNWTGRV